MNARRVAKRITDRLANAGGIALLEEYGAPELVPLMQDGTLRIVGGDPAEPWHELEMAIDPLTVGRVSGESSRHDTIYVLKVLHDRDVESEASEAFEPGEGPHDKFIVETESADMGSDFVEGFATADDFLGWLAGELGT